MGQTAASTSTRVWGAPTGGCPVRARGRAPPPTREGRETKRRPAGLVHDQAVEKRTSLAFCLVVVYSQTDAGRHQPYNKGSLVLFSTACL